ncbi:hypothetical protein WSK_1462 [Novosphingobium sp. Rr 2-17]|uniref:peptidylprolyl isomerase n=1 Tax=Novosphingobium sp. Rr 2-17 TaxID=555793 RepID=UPI0002698EB6|nr:peptidyl-prolyl cis-trans isomerase [Novosphingobium sp. Rr 2-17]EIZ79924.1 hypothetical protein WSK_1462 [Novosphingobium sp. Rr 2-17]
MTDTAPLPASAPATMPSEAALWDIHQPVARRSLILCGIGAVIGLAIAGVGLFTAQGTRTSSIPPEDAAMVNNIPVLRADLIQQVGALYSIDYAKATPAQRRKVLDDMIREELYIQRGIEIGLANDDIDVRTALVSATEGQVAQDALTAKPAEQELRDWYAKHAADYASEGLMTVHEYVLPKGATNAQSAVAGLRSGASPASLGLKSSGRVDDGEEYYFAAEAHLGKTVYNAARKLRDGQVSDPIVQPDGIHIVQMEKNTLPVPAPYEQVIDRVTQDFLNAKVARLQDGNGRFLRKRADIKIASDFQ